MTDSAYPALTTAENIFKAVVWDSLITSILAYYLGPVIALPVIGSAIRFVCTSLTDAIFNEFRLVTDLAIIPLVNNEHKAEYKAASIKLMVLAHDKGITSPEFLKAREDAKNALAKFVSYGAAAK